MMQKLPDVLIDQNNTIKHDSWLIRSVLMRNLFLLKFILKIFY